MRRSTAGTPVIFHSMEHNPQMVQKSWDGGDQRDESAG